VTPTTELIQESPQVIKDSRSAHKQTWEREAAVWRSEMLLDIQLGQVLY